MRECRQTYEEMVREETTRRPSQVRHEVDDNVIDQDSDGGEGNIGDSVSNGNGSGTIEAVACLLLENRTTKHLSRKLHNDEHPLWRQ